MLEAAYLRSPHAHAKLKRIDATRAKDAPGVRGVLVAGEVEWLSDEVSYEGQPVAALAADTPAQARAALELIDVEWDVLEPLLDPEEAVRRGSLIGEARHYARGDYDRGLAEADVVVEAEFRTQTLNHNSLETHQCVCDWRGDGLDVYISTQYIWGVRDEVAEAFEPARRQGARRLRVHGRRLRREGLGGRLHAHRSGARAPERVGRFATR